MPARARHRRQRSSTHSHSPHHHPKQMQMQHHNLHYCVVRLFGSWRLGMRARVLWIPVREAFVSGCDLARPDTHPHWSQSGTQKDRARHVAKRRISNSDSYPFPIRFFGSDHTLALIPPPGLRGAAAKCRAATPTVFSVAKHKRSESHITDILVPSPIARPD